MGFRLIFSRRRFDAFAMNRLAGDFVGLLTAFAADPDQRLAALLLQTARADASYQSPHSDTTGTLNAVSPP
jgi:hypothetical protein